MFTKVITNPKLRSFVRKTGIIKILTRILSKRNSVYEERFSKALFQSINEGDVVWDVGANIGYYTCKFAHAVGSSGKVVAFEPVKATYLRMVAACKNEGLSNVLPVQYALGSCEEQIKIPITNKNDGTTNSLAKRSDNSTDVYELVSVKRGDTVIAEGLPMPDIIKIDVEAYEEEVLFGLRNYLQSCAWGGGKMLKINILRNSF
ncbi:MAG: FkbM family methyltransferase [Bacteroidales bacterium]|jgi:FkbM family methyltransferase|nr:FkbM family methyltransferase [Bacteroidales bacterium]